MLKNPREYCLKDKYILFVGYSRRENRFLIEVQVRMLALSSYKYY